MSDPNSRPSFNRRNFLQIAGVSAAAVAAGISAPAKAGAQSSLSSWGSSQGDELPQDSELFGLGVAAGTPRHDSMILWTRLAPKPLAEDGHGGMTGVDVRVGWEVAKDEGFGDVVKQGEASIYGKVGEVVDGYVRVDNITDEIKALYREALGADVTGDDIFHFVYGKLHDPGYRTKYAADLKKMLPHIETPSSRAEFDKFAAAGKELMDLHVNYESVEPWPLDIQVKGDESDRETWRVLKMKWAKRKDAETGKNVNDVTKLIYNKQVTISGIPAEADEYMLGSRSAVAWLIDRYQVKKDKASGIVNDPNDWADEVGNPRYIVDLVGKVTRVAMETNRIVRGLKG